MRLSLKALLSLFCASAIAAACALEPSQDGVQEDQVETVVFTAAVDDAATRTVLDGTSTEWTAGDKITIHNGTKGYEFKADASGKTVDFTYKGNDFSGTKFMAVYPSGTYTADVNAKTVKANIPTWQQAQKSTWDASAALGVAYSETTSLTFKNATSLLKFKVNTDNVTHVVFHGNKGEGLTGDVTVSLAGTEPEVSVLPTEIIQNGKKVADLGTWVECYAYHDDKNKTFVKGQDYYIAVAPQVFSAGVTAKIRINDGAEIEVKKSTGKATFKAGTIYDLGTFEYTPPVATLYLQPNSNWKKDNARFAAYFFGNGEKWVGMTDADKDGIYEVAIPADKVYPNVIFCRMNPSNSSNNWNNKWNQTSDLTIPTDGKNLYTVKDGTWDKGGGTWSVK